MTWDKKHWAKISLYLTIINIVRLFWVYFQIDKVMPVQFKPVGWLEEISDPIMFAALSCLIGFISALLFYYYSKYVAVIIICMASVLLPAYLRDLIFSWF
jgi:hypothetical protein